MIDFYTWSTPNGYKVALMLEEAGLDYTVHPVDLDKDAQFGPEFLKVSPNNKIPAIVDHDAPAGPISLFESGAILIHLGERSGQFLPTDAGERARVLQWLMWQMAGFGPTLGQLGHFASDDRPADNAYAVKRFSTEAMRLYALLDAQLAETEFIAKDYSIADMALYPWAVRATTPLSKMAGREYANIQRWQDAIAARSATGRAYQLLKG